MVNFRITWTRCTGEGKIRAIAPVGAVKNRTASAQLQTAPTKYRERKGLHILIIHYNLNGNLELIYPYDESCGETSNCK